VNGIRVKVFEQSTKKLAVIYGNVFFYFEFLQNRGICKIGLGMVN